MGRKGRTSGLRVLYLQKWAQGAKPWLHHRYATRGKGGTFLLCVKGFDPAQASASTYAYDFVHRRCIRPNRKYWSGIETRRVIWLHRCLELACGAH